MKVFIWPLNADGKTDGITLSHRTAKVKQGYWSLLSKYMSKAYALPRIYGYISGHSKIAGRVHGYKDYRKRHPI